MWRFFRASVRVIFYATLYLALAILTFVNLSDPSMRGEAPLNVYQWGLLCFVLLIVPAWIAWKTIKRLRRRGHVVATPNRHVLYLRPFGVDAGLQEETFRFLNRAFTLGPLRGDTTLEMGIRAAVQHVGELVAIGGPSDIVTPDGAKLPCSFCGRGMAMLATP